MKKYTTYSYYLALLLFLIGSASVISQVTSGVYLHTTQENGKQITHQIKLTESYLIYTIYENDPAKFVKTMGGFYQINDKTLAVNLEFNSDFETDGLKQLSLPFTVDGTTLTLSSDVNLTFERTSRTSQELDGEWLFATRGPDKGQERRGEENSRKTLKFLMDGTFQWIAYDTASFKFSGTGGGSYSSTDGVYVEQIEFFSKDNDRVGATLNFNYELNGTDWFHTGKNSKGEPLFEIWAKRQ